MSAPCVVHLDVNPGEGLSIVRHGSMSFYGRSGATEKVAGEHLAIAVGASVLDAAVSTLRTYGTTPWVHVRVDLKDVEDPRGGSICIEVVLPAVSEHVEEMVQASMRRAPILGLLDPATPVSIVTSVSAATAGLVTRSGGAGSDGPIPHHTTSSLTAGPSA